MDLLVLAKSPRPGRVKTRLCPPCTAEEAAQIAEAALVDTLAAATASSASRVVLALDGPPGAWCPPGVDLLPQGGGDLGARLARAWASTRGPALQIGMDTPQVTAHDLDRAMATLLEPATDVVLGPAEDGGWWAIGMRIARPDVFAGVPPSRPDTHDAQRTRLEGMGLRVRALGTVRDLDTWDDAVALAAAAPEARVAAAVGRVATAGLEVPTP